MTGPLTPAESFLALLDDLGSAKPNGATAAVLLAHAATHIRDLLEHIGELERERDDLRSLYAVARSAQDVPRPGVGAQGDPATGTALPRVTTGPGHPDLSHLPPAAGDGEPMCDADSLPDPDANGASWACNARLGHPERWHAGHDSDGTPYAAWHPGAAWPVTDRETGLPRWAAGWSANPRGSCLATLGRWTCNAVPGHEPADHVAFAPWSSAMAGAVLARWPSVRPGSAVPAGVASAVAASDLGLNGHSIHPAKTPDVRCTCNETVCWGIGCRACARSADCPYAPVATCGALSPDGQMTCDLMAGHLSRHEQLDAAGVVTGEWPPDPLPPDAVPGQPSRCLCQPDDPSHPGPGDAEDCHCECHLDAEVTS